MSATSLFSALRRKLCYITPDRPSRRYNVVGGTTALGDWLTALRLLVSPNVTSDGGAIRGYEERFASVTGARYAVSFGAGRMALYALLEVFGIGDTDEVIVPAFTCVVVPNAILYRGAQPVYVDIEQSTFNIDVTKIEAAITPRTKAILAQHTFGLPCDVAGIQRIARSYGLVVIEDGALALGSHVAGAPVGSLGDAAFFSTDRSKTINTHLGGMAVTNDAALAARLRVVQESSSFLKDFVVRKILFTFIVEYVLFAPAVLWIGRSVWVVLMKLGMLYYFGDELQTVRPSAYPYPCRLSSAQARIGLRELSRFGVNVNHRRAIVSYLESKLGPYGGTLHDLGQSVMLRYSFLVHDRAAFEARFAHRFDLGIWFTSVVHCRDRGLDCVGYRLGSCPVAEYVTRHIANFPTHPRIPLSMIQAEVSAHWSWLESQIIRQVPIH